jgi:hypothetical protein
VVEAQRRGVTAIAALLVGCSGAPVEVVAVTPEAASEQVTFGTLQDLGAFTFQYTTRDERKVSTGSTVRETAASLKWKDRDTWEYTTVNDGIPATHWLISGARAWQSLSGAPLVSKGDPEPLRAQLALGWDPWEDVVAMTAGRIVYGPGTEETVDGRPAVRHDLSLGPGPATRGKHIIGQALSPTSLTGQVWIDKETSVRLLADLVVAASNAPPAPVAAADDATAPQAPPEDPGDRLRERTFAVKLAVTGLGQDPGVSTPPGSPIPPVPSVPE